MASASGGAESSAWIEQSLSMDAEKMRNFYRDDWLWRVNPYIRYAQYGLLEANSCIGPRIICDYEIVYIKAGKADIVIDGKRYHASQGDFFFFKPGVEHAMYIFDEPLVQPHIHFDLRYESHSPDVPVNFCLLEEMPDEHRKLVRTNELPRFFETFPDHMRFSNPLYIEQLFFDVIYSFSLPGLFNELRLKWQFLRMLDHLLVEVSWQQTRPNRLISVRAQQIRLYLERHLDRRVTLQELADVYHLDKSYISRCYRKVYNTSPVHAHLLLRLNRAKSMVIYTNLSLSDIAEQNGFASLQDFSRVFRRLEGRSPSSFREGE